MDADGSGRLTDSGEPLGEGLRRRLEALLGRSLRDVRIHDNAPAERLTKQIGAAGFSIGRHVYVRQAAGSAPTRADLGLLVHEVTHAVQQTNPGAPSGAPAPRPIAPLRPVQRAAAGAQPPGEQAATSMEVAAQHSSPAIHASPHPVDPEELAERVYQLIVRDLQLERERGVHSWHNT